MVGPALALALRSLAGERERAAYVRRRLAAESKYLPPASVIVPVKGPEEGLRENLAALASLDYPDYELVVAAHASADIPPGVLPHAKPALNRSAAALPAVGAPPVHRIASLWLDPAILTD